MMAELFHPHRAGKKPMKANIGIKRIVEESRQIFRRPENLLHSSETDYQEAERKFVKFMLESGGVRQDKRRRPVL